MGWDLGDGVLGAPALGLSGLWQMAFESHPHLRGSSISLPGIPGAKP